MPKTRRKQRKRNSRKKRGGEINPFMFKSTHNLQMNKMQKQIDDRDRTITKTMNEAMKIIAEKKGVMNELSEEQHQHLKDKVHDKLQFAKEKIAKQSAEKFKDALIKDLKEKADELKASEQKLQNCDQIKEGLNKAFNELQEDYNELDENFDNFIDKSEEKMNRLEKEEKEANNYGYILREIIKKLQGVKCKGRAINANLICDALQEIIDDDEDESVKRTAQEQCIYLNNGELGKRKKKLCKLKDDDEKIIDDEDDLKKNENYDCDHGNPYGHVNRFTVEKDDDDDDDDDNDDDDDDGYDQPARKHLGHLGHKKRSRRNHGGRRTRRRKSRKRKSKKKRRRRKRKRTKKKRRRKSRR